ncbi:dephospho-CoA kinase [Neokomagataea thailandica NBRC 106555]|uniref:Dephospho-CoA kinase n=1 Tax=Neokomagataea thailandica NBRC 106555 TaxID=1223520 RepID=A0ABQ0QQI6_9PROT|nr:dephospho-CoA kinase [Neokomagataea thailandica]GBR53372.1 dephospho-CoA kinase [Neokomagataea thailandica NBRC 106555]
MLIIGLTGGMAAGKSTVAALFRRAGIPVFDADATVRKLQAPGGRAVPEIARLFPGAVCGGVLNRQALRQILGQKPQALKALEGLMHPLVRAERKAFLQKCQRAGAYLCVLDIPLLMEIGEDKNCDVVVVVEAPMATRLSRITQRGRAGSMNMAQARQLLARQMSDCERRRRADIVIRTGLSRGQAALRVRALVQKLRKAA